MAGVEVNGLRGKLREYYEAEGAGHAIHIEIPVGSYVPVFVRPDPREADARPAVIQVRAETASASPVVRENRPLSKSFRNKAALYAALAVSAATIAFVTLKTHANA